MADFIDFDDDSLLDETSQVIESLPPNIEVDGVPVADDVSTLSSERLSYLIDDLHAVQKCTAYKSKAYQAITDTIEYLDSIKENIRYG